VSAKLLKVDDPKDHELEAVNGKNPTWKKEGVGIVAAS